MTAELQDLCDQILALGDILSCSIIGLGGEILGTNFGPLPLDEELKKSFGGIAAVVWGALKRAEDMAGPLTLATFNYENMKILGVPVPGSRVGILVAISSEIDALVIRDRILSFVQYWRKTKAL